MNRIHFNNRTAVVTGAGHGLGRDYALFLGSRGARVVVNDLGTSVEGVDRSRGPAEKVASIIVERGGSAVANFDSVAEPEGAQRIVEDALRNFGSMDILINNAGILRDKTFINMALEDFESVLKVHLIGSVYLTKAAFPAMRKGEFGRIVFTTSTAGLYGNFGQTNYGTAKMGLLGLMNSLKHEGQKYNILVNTVSPLAVTRLAEVSGIFSEEIASMLRPEKVTPVVAYLCSDECRISGSVICAGGGYFAAARMMEGPGIRFDPEEEILPEMVSEKLDSILDMDGAVPFGSAKEELDVALGPLLERITGGSENGAL